MRVGIAGMFILSALSACDCGQALQVDQNADAGQAVADAAGACAIDIAHQAIDEAPYADIEIVASSSAALTLHYRRSLEGQDFVVGEMQGQGEQRASVPLSVLSLAGVDYYISADDGACTARLPGDDSQYFHVEIYGEIPVSLQRDQYDYSPCVYQHQVVFSREDSQGDNVFLFDLDRMQQVQLTFLDKDQGNAEIFGRNVIWDDYRLGSQTAPNSDIYLLDLDGNDEHQVTTNLKSQYASVLDGRLIAWRDDRNMDGPINGDIFVYDMGPDAIFGNADDGGEFQITSSAADQSSPDVHVRDDGRALVVWHDMRDDSDGVCDANCDQNIYYYDSGADGEFGTADDRGPLQVTEAAGEQSSAAVGDRWIVWRDARAGDRLHPELYAWDMGPDGIFGNDDDGGEQKLNIDGSEPDDLDMDGDRLVYDDYRNGSYEIYLYEFSKAQETQITDAYRGQFYPRIFGDVIVWQDARNNDPQGDPLDDIYAYRLRSQ